MVGNFHDCKSTTKVTKIGTPLKLPTIRYVDGEIRDVTKIAQIFNEQASTGTFVPGFMATYCHIKLSLAALKAQNVLSTSENERTPDIVAVTNSSADSSSRCMTELYRHYWHSWGQAFCWTKLG